MQHDIKKASGIKYHNCDILQMHEYQYHIAVNQLRSPVTKGCSHNLQKQSHQKFIITKSIDLKGIKQQ